MKFVRNGKTNRRELLVAPQRGETLDIKRADMLANESSVLLLGFVCEKQRGGGVLMHYDVEGLWSLRTYLSKRPMGTEELMGLLEAVEGVLDLCAEQHLGAEGLLFEPEYVFVDAQCCPRFALIPLADQPFQAQNSPLALLSAMGGEHLRFSSPEAEGIARRVHELVVDLGEVFSVNRFRRFLEEERQQVGGGLVPDARRSVVEPDTSSVWASVGSASETTAKGDGSLFWSPLAGFAETEPAETKESKQGDAPQLVWEPQPVAESQPAVAAQAPRPAEVVEPQPAVIPQTPRPVAEPQPATIRQAPPQPAPAAWLIRLATGERYPLPQGQQVRVGRGSACDIRLLDNRKLSRIHAAFTVTGQMVMVTDLGAANGVFVDGVRVQRMQSVLMSIGQRLRLADEELLIGVGQQ